MPTNLWGNATWLFFHVLVENIPEEKFDKLKPVVIDIIKDTCRHLPCPYCAEDATKVINQGFIHNIKNREHLIEFMRQFHNIVNIKLDNKRYSIEETKDLNYKKYNLMMLINNLFKIYTMKHGIMKLMPYNLQRGYYLKRLQQNIQKFQEIKYRD